MSHFTSFYEPEPDVYTFWYVEDKPISYEYHITKGGKTIRLDEMSDQHLINCYKKYSKNNNPQAYKFYLEIRLRYPHTYRRLLCLE